MRGFFSCRTSKRGCFKSDANNSYQGLEFIDPLKQLASARQQSHISDVMQTNTAQPADVILRSSDAKMYYSWKIFLSLSSPVFNEMFNLPQPSNNNNIDESHWHDGLPVVDLAEDSHILGRILSLCLPPSCTGEEFKVNNVHDLRNVLEATMKYDMEKIHCVALKELANPSFLHEDPLRIYILACQYQYHEAACLAARHTLAFPMLTQNYVPELERIHAGKLWYLFSYRGACTAAACSLVEDHMWIIHTRFLSLFSCKDDEDTELTTVRCPPSRKYPAGRTELNPVHKWWKDYMKKAGGALQKFPCSDSVKDKELVNGVLSAISSSECKQCKASQLEVWETFQSFVDSFAEEIDRSVAKVCSESLSLS